MNKIVRGISRLNVLLLIVHISFSSLLFVALPTADSVAADDQLCPAAVDVVLIMDRSGSMGYTSKCDWWQLKCVDSPQCTSYAWQLNTDYNGSEAWCQSKNQSVPHNSVWTGYDPTKIESARAAANNFLNSMGAGDQSALVSFATDVTLDQALSHDHTLTQTAINNIAVTGATNIGDAISFGVDELRSSRANPQAVKAMILLTDGRANKPNGSGYGENAADVTYAISQATEAAGYGYKVFTVGLGSGNDINEVMLGQIADITGANYHHASNGSDLSDIYDEIGWKICQYGSISGCKWLDQNGDGEQQQSETEVVANWEISLAGDAEDTQYTDESGCYQFSGLAPGNYWISETGQTGWTQTYPVEPDYYTVTLSDWNQHLAGYDFGNFDSSVCEPEDIPGECTQPGYREHSYSYNYAHCGQDYTDTVADESCDCGGGGGSGGGGGGGSFTPNAKVELDYDYVAEKAMDAEYEELVIVKNDGNIILTNGVLKIDLPEGMLGFTSASPSWDYLNGETQTASWDISAMAVGAESVFKFIIKTIGSGTPLTQVEIDFDQAEAEGSFSEVVLDQTDDGTGNQDGVGGSLIGYEQETDDDGDEPGGEDTSGEPESPLGSVVPKATNLVEIEEPTTTVDETVGEGVASTTDESASDEGEDSDQSLNSDEQGAVAGVAAASNGSCPRSIWWSILVVILYFLTVYFAWPSLENRPVKYRFYLSVGLAVVSMIIIIALGQCWI